MIPYSLSYRVSFAIIGGLVGALFPICATLIDIWLQVLPLSLDSIIAVQRKQPLHWIIDSAPFFLGVLAAYSGDRQDLLAKSLSDQVSTNLLLESEVNERRDAEKLTKATLLERDRLAKQLEWLIESMPLGLATYDSIGHVVDCNDAFGSFVKDDKKMVSIVYERALSQPTGASAAEIEINYDGLEKFVVLARVDQDSEDKIWVLLADITDQKVQERQLMQASKLATLGELATSIAHEINQPLNHIALVMATVSGLLSQSNPSIEKIKSKLIKVDSSIARAAKITDHLRTFGRIDLAEFKPTSIVSAINGAVLLFDNELNTENIKIELDIESELPNVRVIETQLEQVFLNLIGNARDSIVSSGATIRIIFITARVHAEAVVIEVRDTGGGMSKEQLKKVFEPFYTTKAVGSGTGLGGSVSYNIITGFGGVMSAMNWQGSDEGHSGAKILITLPRLFNDTLMSDDEARPVY